jgi:hypothetical protein
VPTLIGRQQLSVLVDYFALCFQDSDDLQVPVVWPEGWEPGVFLRARQGRLDITTAAHTHFVGLAVEVWDRRPSAPDGQWDECAEAALRCVSGELTVWSMAGGPAEETVRLPAEVQDWAVRVVCAGRAEAAEQAVDGVPEDVERYIAQFWPKP